LLPYKIFADTADHRLFLSRHLLALAWIRSGRSHRCLEEKWLAEDARAMDADSVFTGANRMKMWSKIILLVVSLVGLGSESFAGPACGVTLQWQASSDPSVAGYALYYGVNGSPMTNRMDVGLSTEATLDLVASSTYSFYVVAYDLNLLESDPSSFLLYTAPAISAVGLTQAADGTMAISFHVAPGGACHVEYTDTLSPPNWTVLKTAAGDSNGLVTISDPVSAKGSRYYRGVVP
jgi:hypothetical protein